MRSSTQATVFLVAGRKNCQGVLINLDFMSRLVGCKVCIARGNGMTCEKFETNKVAIAL